MRVFYIKRRYLLLGISFIIIMVGLGSIGLKKWKISSVFYLPITNKIIAIDPGHGGPDPGKVSKAGYREDQLNLEIALNLKRLIEQSGGVVVMTRETGRGLHSPSARNLREMKSEDLKKRKEIVNTSDSQICISIHLNSFEQAKYYGAQTFYRKDSIEGGKLAAMIQNELKNVLDSNNDREPQERDDIYILNEIEVPVVLVECGFLSNENEEKLLAEEIYQEKIAWSIYIGIMNYFNQINQ